MNEKVTARDVAKAIAQKYSDRDWTTFFEVADGTGTLARRRADAIAMNIWPSKGYAIHGFEIKVSRADFLQEMRDISKAEAFAKYCDFWWLAVAPGVLDPKEVPEKWGLMILHKNGLKVKKQAQQRADVTPIGRDMMASILRRSRDTDNAYVQQQMEMERSKAKADAERQAERKYKRAVEDAKKNRVWIEKFEAALGGEMTMWADPEEVAARVRLAKSLDWGPMGRLMTSCGQLVEQINDFRSVLDRRDAAQEEAKEARG